MCPWSGVDVMLVSMIGDERLQTIEEEFGHVKRRLVWGYKLGRKPPGL